MSPFGTRAPEVLGSGVRMVVALLAVITLLTVVPPRLNAAQFRDAQQASARTQHLQKETRVPRVRKRPKQRRTAKRLGESRNARRHRVAALGTPKAKRQTVRRQAKRPVPRRVAQRRADSTELIIAQGDGPPVLKYAAGFLGRPYRFGSDRGAFDCSGFVRTVFAKVGIELPRSAREQFALGDRVARHELEPGDLVFFRTYQRYATHVGIYVGEDKFVHAAARSGQVQVDSLTEHYYARRYLGARRLEI